MTTDLARQADKAVMIRCYAVIGPGVLCREAARPGQVFCVGHLSEATTERQLAEARLEQSRTAVLTRAADNLDGMLRMLVDTALDVEADGSTRVRAAARVLEVAGMLGSRRAEGSLLQQINVTVHGAGAENVTDADARLLDLIARLGPEGERRAGALRSVIETGVVDR